MTNSLLAWHLRQLARPIEVRPLDLQRDVRDLIGRLELDRSGPRLRFRTFGVRLEPSEELTDLNRRHPGALCACDLVTSDSGARGDIVPFTPPRTGTLDVAVPVRVPEPVLSDLGEVGLREGADLVRADGVEAGGRRYALVGLHTLASLDEDEAASVAWWRTDGSAVHLRRRMRGDRLGLEVVGVVPARDAARTLVRPNTLVELGPSARLELARQPADPQPSRADAMILVPPRSELFETWARYAAIERREHDLRQAERGRSPISYVSGRQSGAGWLVDARMTPEEIVAWLGAEAQEGKEVRVGQPVGLKGSEEGRFDLAAATLRGPGQIELRLEPDRGSPSLPSSGILEARQDFGAKTKRDRERAAAERLMGGAAACPQLLDILLEPGRATPPQVRPLPVQPEDRLDRHQEHAVRMILGCEDVVAIQGPPGTGKTRVIVEALRQLAAARADRKEPLRVLISSVQNEAVLNVVERLGKTEGVLVRLVTRRARSDEESLEFAQRRQVSLQRVLEQLDARLAEDDVASRLVLAKDLRANLLTLRRDLALPDSRDRLVARLRALASEPDSLLTLTLRDDASALADRLAAPAGEPRPPAVRAEVRPVPQDPGELASWWDEVENRVPTAERAEVGMEVQLVVRAASSPPSPRRSRRLDRRWPPLRERLEELLVDDGARQVEGVTEQPIDVGQEVGRWLGRALVAVGQFEDSVRGSRAGLLYGFREALAEDPAAWGQILDRYGPTVAATCSMAATVADDPRETFDWVIIDEAGRASPFELMVPLVQGRRVVLIGDHRQLPPMVDQAIERHARRETTLPADLTSETLFGALYAGLPSGCRTRLAMQYRMHGSIGQMVDELFYRPHGESVASWFADERADARRPVWGVLEDRAAVWVHVRRRKRGAPQRENRYEVDAVLDLLRRYRAGGAGDGEIGLICPYQKQRGALAKKLEAAPELAAICQLRTIDGVQGREWAAVIVCLTRDDGTAGFLASPNRVNVAISRAQRQLVVVGCQDVFASSERVRRTAPHLAELARRLPRGLEA